LSPKEKALRLLDRIINTLNENGFVKDRVKENANELKDLLKNIFQIASEQTKSISADYIERKTKLTKDINDIDKSIETKTELLNDLILNSSIAEEALNKIRKEQSAVDSEVKKLESERSIAELDLRSISEKITNLRVELKSHEIQLDSSNKKINQAGINIDTINFDNYENLDVEELQKNIEILQEKILKLGAINLAAPNEIAEELKRKEELDSQYDELIDALEKLSAAIKKIDEETKTRFKNSFDAVNARIKEVFPKLFGGGFAELSLTENDTLNAGVVLMARPPGKKNTSISQLSGGEKALTALALVFSIFELNPAPFCMLDEVDAPLDDLNTMRFINMVEEMSKTIQFIFITHNKVSMERSDHLMGVTMQEAGVSRMVSVDVNQALEFAET
jgi:chromosome segregation protein